MAVKVYVLDTMAFLTAGSFTMAKGLYTVPGVYDELKSSVDKRRFDILKDAGLNVRAPSEDHLERVKKAARTTGDSERLSDVDNSLAALALELDAVLVTDDYSLQNLAAVLGLTYIGVEEKCIKKIFNWELKCTGCARVWDTHYESCPICGSPLRTSRKKK